MVRAPQRNSSHRSTTYLSVVLILVAIAVVVYFVFFHKTNNNQKLSTVSNTSTENNGTSSKISQGTNQSLGDNQSNQTSSSGGSGSSAPQAPTGTFVSNHKPDLLGTPAPNSEQSTCSVPPGTACYINFTQGSVTRTLESQTAGPNGVIAWTWTLQEIGITQGDWNISAVSSLNGQTATTPDTIPLEVGP